MATRSTILVTGALGFIGKNVMHALAAQGHDLIAVDRPAVPDSRAEDMTYRRYISASSLFEMTAEEWSVISHVIHLGASVDTGDTDMEAMLENNFVYSKKIFEKCVQHGISLMYASSAATYGDGSRGFSDQMHDLQPRNAYAISKHQFDVFVRESSDKPPQCVGLKFFNVYGPHEEHKGRMASTVYFAYQQAKEDGVIKLFRSHNPEYRDGEQKRDFIYVGDIVNVILFFVQNPSVSGLFNLGTGEARTFIDLAYAVFAALMREPKIVFIDIPEQFREKYQYFTEADMGQLRAAGYTQPFRSLEAGVAEYIRYLEAKA